MGESEVGAGYMNPWTEFANLVSATRGAIAWLQETGVHELSVEPNFVMPRFDGDAVAYEATLAQGAETPQRSLKAQPVPPTGDESDVLQRFAALTQSGNSGATASKANTPKRTPPTHQKPIRPLASPPIGPIKGGDMAQRAANLQTLKEEIQEAIELPIIPGGPTIEWVFGQGHPGARVMFVADAPRAADNDLASPFVGEAGRLLSRMIHAMGLKRTDVFLTYLVPYFDPRTDPESAFDNCEGFFANAVDIVKPEVIVVFGEAAARRLSGRNDAFPHLRGQWFEYRKIPLLPTFHPEVLNQLPQGKAHVWNDLKAVMRFLGISVSA